MSEQNAAAMVMQSGMAIQRVENDTLVQIAIARPRDEEKIEKQILRTVQDFPDFAEEALYEFERGGKSIRGISVVASREIARVWGNNTTRTAFISNGDEITACGIFVDIETGRRSEKQVIVPRIVKRNRQPYRLPDDEYNMQARIEASKMERNATLDCLPVPLKNRIYDACVATLDNVVEKGKDTPAVRWKKSQAVLEKFGVTTEQVLAYLKIDTAEKLTHSALNRLGRTMKAITDGETSVAAVFGSKAEEPSASDQAPVAPSEAGAEVKERSELGAELEQSIAEQRLKFLRHELEKIPDGPARDAAMDEAFGSTDWEYVGTYSIEDLQDAIARIPEIIMRAIKSQGGELFPKGAK